VPASVSARLVDWLADPAHGVAITGASGWVGRAMAHGVVEAAGPAGAPKLRLFGSAPRRVEIAGRSLPVETLRGAPPLGAGEWLVLHLAVAGADRVGEPDALRALNDAMLDDVLTLAGTGQVRRLVCASSGAVYQAGQGSPEKQAYSELKRDQEAVARTWAGEHGVSLLIPRIFNVGGPYMTHPDRYALGDFIRQARTGGMIEIGARRPVLRSYVHVLELAAVTFDLALGEDPMLVFDTAGPQVVEMADLAAAVGRALRLPRLEIRRPALEAGGEDRYVGDDAVYRAALARMGAEPIDLDEIIRDTAEWLAL
jgi:nucleoside-diphosphate-sugar epimerase